MTSCTRGRTFCPAPARVGLPLRRFGSVGATPAYSQPCTMIVAFLSAPIVRMVSAMLLSMYVAVPPLGTL